AAAPKKAASAGAGAVKIEAGAAGKVFKIEKQVGAAVKKGDAVVIVEAMKMEIPMVAPQDGTVASIDCAVGDAVEAGAVLATLN
ncbi:MAG: acetyl-CoA carboxylase biotin carboxyl carrier protein subunit, partial [Bacillota bacterium]|nr:acetyl-CoA carboxylase biotin carboxyl carrier protein subunit [Bacillota bacterium]